MKAEQNILNVLHAKRKSLGGELALLAELDPKGPKYLAFGKQGRQPHERPVVVTLQGADKGVAPERIVATTTPPDESEIGMAWKYGIKRIIFWDLNEGKEIVISLDGSQFTPKPLSLGPTEINLLKPGIAKIGDPVPFTDTSAANWLAALERKKPTELETAGVRAKEAISKPVYEGRVAVGNIVNKGLNIIPSAGLAKQPFADMVFMHLAFALVGSGWRTKGGRDDDAVGYNIGSILVDSTQKIISWGLNHVEINKSYHAETLMIQAYLQRTAATELPRGCVMYTSLESCHMCAGFAAEVGNGLRVVYGQGDSQIKNNALQRKVKGSSQDKTKITFTPSFTPPPLVGRKIMEQGPAVAALEHLKSEYVTLGGKKGVVAFLFDDLAKYFYDIESKMPGQTVGRLTEIAKAPVLSQPMMRTVDPHAHLDLAVRGEPTRPTRDPLARLDLALPKKSPGAVQREAFNNKHFGAELRLAEYALKFLKAL